MTEAIQNTSDLATYMSRQYPQLKPQQSSAFIRTLFATIARSLRGQLEENVADPHVQIYGFGNIHTTTRGPRKARNPRTGEGVEVGTRHSLKLNPSVSLKKYINEGGEDYFSRGTADNSFDDTNSNGEFEVNAQPYVAPLPFPASEGPSAVRYATRTKRMSAPNKKKSMVLKSNISSHGIADAAPTEAKRGRGRPKGSGNKNRATSLASNEGSYNGATNGAKRGPGRPKGSGNKSVASSSNGSGPANIKTTAFAGATNKRRGRPAATINASLKSEAGWMREARKAGWEKPNE